jgi:hypothetical protein
MLQQPSMLLIAVSGRCESRLPDHLVQVGWIYVFIEHGDKAAMITNN